jgi:DNA-binding XRE family transcriptional regulator
LPSKTEVSRHEKPIPAAINTIGDLLVVHRKKAGLTQEQLAQISGIHRQWLGRWERGRALPDAANWSRLQKLLNMPMHCIDVIS